MMLMARGDARLRLTAGLLVLAALLGFVAAALGAILVEGGLSPSLPPMAYLGRILGFTLLQATLSVILSVGLASPWR